MLRVVAILVIAVVVSLFGSGTITRLLPSPSLSGPIGSVVNVVVQVAGVPLVVLAQAAAAFVAAYLINRRGWLVGAVVGGCWLPFAIYDTASYLAEDLATEGTLFYLPLANGISDALVGAIVGAFAGAAGSGYGRRVSPNKSLERTRGE